MEYINDPNKVLNNSTEPDAPPSAIVMDDTTRCEYCELLDDLLLMAVSSEDFIGLTPTRRSDIHYLTTQLKKVIRNQNHS